METQAHDHHSQRRFFFLACVLESALFVVGAALSAFFGFSFLSNLHWDAAQFLLSLAAVAPLFALFLWACRSPWGPLRRIRHFLDHSVLPILRSWSVPQLLLISVLAGLGEEFFFRGAVQGGLASRLGDIPALIMASLLFGSFHPMTGGYLILTSLIGLYLGGLWIWTGNLLVPIVIHALYDFLALYYLVKFTNPMLPAVADAD